ncbi:hypothetical protein CCP4SC76_6450001 [Gammaproteobacteria bacterium]
MHVSWDGLIIHADDPWWKEHFPPGGYGCKCYVESLAPRDMKKLGKTGPDKAPDNGTYDWMNPDGTVREAGIPQGIDPGFNYTPGESQADRLRGMFSRKLWPEGIKRKFEGDMKQIDPGLAKALGDKMGNSLPPIFPLRTLWLENFPKVDIHASESLVKKHLYYNSAKSGNAESAMELAVDLGNNQIIEALARYRSESPIFVPVHGIEGSSINEIPMALSRYLSMRLGFDMSTDIVQTSKAGHTGASGWWRLLSPALFDGDVISGRNYILVDDFIGMGGTLANLRGYIESQGGRVLQAQSLTGKPRSAILSLQPETLKTLRDKYGNDLESWWYGEFGYRFSTLTESEAQYLIRAGDADTIRTRLAEARRKGS